MPLPSGPLMSSAEVQNNVSTRVQRAMEELAAKGEAQRQAKALAEIKAQAEEQAENEAAEIEAIRQARISRMKQERGMLEQNRAKGHGEVATISQDEFLSTVTSSTRCAVHFFHSQFEQCHIMDAHLAKLAAAHLETRFARMDSEKAPFFIQRLSVRVLPSVLLFEDGKLIGRQTGFQGLGEGPQVLSRLEASFVRMGVLESRALAAASENEDDDEDQFPDQRPAGERLVVGAKASGRRISDDW